MKRDRTIEELMSDQSGSKRNHGCKSFLHTMVKADEALAQIMDSGVSMTPKAYEDMVKLSRGRRKWDQYTSPGGDVHRFDEE